MNSKLLGGILLIMGTSVGGGMLALPVATAQMGFGYAVLFLIGCWAVMTVGALLVLEVNLRLPVGSNMVSMAGATLGKPGQVMAWIAYLLLLYTLLAGYISGGSDIFSSLMAYANIQLPSSITALIFTAFFGVVVYSGIQAVDFVNRGLMFGKLGVFLLLVAIIMPHVHVQLLKGGEAQGITGALMILITSFGFASIVPSLREYFQDDIHSLRKVILWGSLIPLSCYIAWVTVIMGTVERMGDVGLLALMHSSHATSGLTSALNASVHSHWISGFFAFFSSICMLTAFLGVSIGLFDFLADGLSLKKSGVQGTSIFVLAFVPPLLVVLINPGVYLQALKYAGVCCVVLLLLMPTMMAWKGRQQQDNSMILVPGGRMVLASTFLVSIFLLFLAF